jgi:hypothetical protein
MAQPLDVVVAGQALETNGFTAFDTIAGIGLVSFGFLWPCSGIWSPADDTITTVWSNDTASSTEVCTD